MRFGLFRPPPATRTLMIVLTVLPLMQWLLLNGFHINTATWTVMSADLVLSGQLWRLVTYVFTYVLVLGDLNSMAHWAFDLLILWSMGSHFESTLGPTKLYKLFFATSLVASLTLMVAPFINVPAFTGMGVWGGADAAIIGMCMAFSFLYPDEIIQFWIALILPVSIAGRYFGPVVAVLAWAIGQVPPIMVLSAILATWLMIKKGVWLEGARFQRKGKSKSKPKSRLQFVAPSAQKVTPIRPDPELFRQRAPEDNEVDRILDKLRDEGMTALSAEERSTLDAHSRKLRQRDGG